VSNNKYGGLWEYLFKFCLIAVRAKFLYVKFGEYEYIPEFRIVAVFVTANLQTIFFTLCVLL
jgi:hypothetical protein